MKRTYTLRLSALLLAAALLLSLPGTLLPVRAEPGSDSAVQTQPEAGTENPADGAEPSVPTEPDASRPISQWTDEELIEAYDVPDNWARKALLFALRTGLLKGKGEAGLCPEDTTTRAEMATLAVRVLGTKTAADLSAFEDVKPDAWYCQPISRAVAAGLLKGTSSTTMSPGQKLTREQAFTVLARMFGVCGTGTASLWRFSDWADVSDWAAPSLAAMVDAGLIHGSGRTLNPQGTITRQELAQVFYNALDGLGKALPENPYSGRFALSARTVPAGTVVEGDLLLSNDAEQIRLKNVTVTGRLILQGAIPVSLRLENCTVGELVICRETDLTTGGGVACLTVNAATTLRDEAQNAVVYDSLTVAGEAAVQTVVLAKAKAKLCLDGAAETVEVNGKNCRISGDGRIEQLNVHAAGLRCTCGVGARTEEIEPGLSELEATRLDSGAATAENPKLTLGLRFTNAPSGTRNCMLLWAVEGKQISAQPFLLSEGAEASVEADFTEAMEAGLAAAEITVTLAGDTDRFVYRGTVDLSDGIRQAAEKIRTQGVQATLRYAANLYSSYSISGRTFSGYLQSVPTGTRVTILKTSRSTGARVCLPNGTVGWLSYGALSISTGNYYTTTDYPTAVKEYYVNKIKNCSSSTEYLIWVSLYTQRVNIFRGSQGNWKLIRSSPCSSGRNTCPTPVGEVTVLYKTARWSFTNYYVHHVTVFDETRAFHSRTYHYDGTIYDAAMGYPASDGCVRMLDEDCTWIYENIPAGTKILLY